VTSISSSGPTRHLCQPSEGASGDCDGITTTAAMTLPTLPPTSTLALALREIEEGERRREEARVEGRCERRRRLDVSRPHVIPSYSTLSVRTSAARRIYERFSAILPPWKIVIAWVLQNDDLPDEAVPLLEFSDNLFLLIALSNDLRQPVLLDCLIVHSFFLVATTYEQLTSRIFENKFYWLWLHFDIHCQYWKSTVHVTYIIDFQYWQWISKRSYIY